MQQRPRSHRFTLLLRRGLRLLAWPLLALTSAACSSTMRHPASEPTPVILRFTYDGGKPMRHDNYIGVARQQLSITQCSKPGSTRTCDVGIDLLFMSGDTPLDANGEVRVTLRSTGPIGDYPSERCINGKAYVFSSGKWIPGPFSPGQVIAIDYRIREIKMACPTSSSTPGWWENRDNPHA